MSKTTNNIEVIMNYSVKLFTSLFPSLYTGMLGLVCKKERKKNKNVYILYMHTMNAQITR